MTTSDGNELSKYWELLRQHHFKIVLAFLLSSGTALILSFYLPPTYEASALLEVRSTEPPSPIATNVFQSVLSGNLSRGDLETIVRRFTTESLLRHTLDQLEMESNPGAQYLPPIGRLRTYIQARADPDTSYITVRVRLPERYGGERNAALLANRLIQTLQEWRALAEKQKASARQQILEQRLDMLYRQLEQEEGELLRFMKDQGSPATWYPLLSNLLERQKELLAALRSRRTALAVVEEEHRVLQKRLQEYTPFERTSETVSADPIATALQKQLLNLEADIAAAREQYGEASPELQALEKKHAVVQQQVMAHAGQTQQTTTRSMSPLYLEILRRQWTTEISILRARQEIAALEDENRELETQLRDLLHQLPSKQYDFDLIKRKIESLYSILLELQKRRIDAEILLAETEPSPAAGPYPVKGGLALIDKAFPRKIPVSPDRRFIVTVGAMTGLGLGFLWALLSAFFVGTYASDRKRDAVPHPKKS